MSNYHFFAVECLPEMVVSLQWLVHLSIGGEDES